jgi:hypothetical protein
VTEVAPAVVGGMRPVLNSVPIGVLMVIAVVVSAAVVIGAVWLVRRVVPSTRDGFHAEISAPMLGVVAALFGLVLAFVIILAYENFIDAADNASQEADAIAAIVRDSDAFPEPGRTNVKRAAGEYVRSVVEVEWPLMHEGRESELAQDRLGGLFAAFRTVRPTNAMETGFFDDATRQLNNALDARRDRVDTATGGLPSDIAILVIFSSIVIVGYAILVGSPSFWFHALGPLAIAIVIALSLVVLADLTYPFSGDVALKPDDFDDGVLAQFFQK